ncbi:FHA domain-containing protein [Actinomyces sp. B33]|nr:FHA domain-containing protein [Actinomyces sp. B33]
MSGADEADAPVALSARDREAVEALPAGSALLIVQRGPNTGARFLLDPEVTNAGRSPRSDIFLDDVTVSRKHCQFLAEDGGHVVRDSGSLNGTYVNRERVEQARLQAGDEVQIGKYRLTYQPSPRRA